MGLFDFFKSKSHTDELLQQHQQQTAATQGAVRGELLVVEDAFTIKGRGTVATGVALAPIAVGQQLTIQRTNGASYASTITGVEAFKSNLQSANPGDNVGLLLSNIDRSQIGHGDRITAG